MLRSSLMLLAYCLAFLSKMCAQISSTRLNIPRLWVVVLIGRAIRLLKGKDQVVVSRI